jgi:amino acid transporter
VFESIFSFFFKYRPSIFSQGDLAFGAAWPLSAGIFVAAAIAVAALLTYRGVKPQTKRDQAVLIALRVAAVALIAFCLFRPVLVLRGAVPQQNFVAVLLDDSRSMQIGDGGQPRAELVRQLSARTARSCRPSLESSCCGSSDSRPRSNASRGRRI